MHQLIKTVLRQRANEKVPRKNALQVKTRVLDACDEVIPQPSGFVVRPGACELFRFQLQVLIHVLQSRFCLREMLLANGSNPLKQARTHIASVHRGRTSERRLVLQSGHSDAYYRESAVPRVILDGVTKIFDEPGGQTIRALSELSLTLEEKECLVLVGPSGSGKTTALRLIAGLEEPTSGTITINGKVANGVPPKDRDVAMVFQSPALYPHMSVHENLSFGLRLRRWPTQEADARVREVAEILGLTACLASRPPALSGGQRQRVAIGRAVARRSGALLLDEPLASVDPRLRQQLRGEILSFRKRFGTAIIYVTHDHVEAMLVGDRVAVLHAGMLQQVAEPTKLYQRPANLFVAGFVGSPPMNLFRGVLSRPANELLFQVSDATAAGLASPTPERPCLILPTDLILRLESWLNKAIVVGVRPEHIGCGSGELNAPARGSFKAKVLTVETSGPDTYLQAAFGSCCFTARVPSVMPITLHQECVFTLDTRAACFFDPVNGHTII
jgi:multiple sugar transport system ATP-binding protein